MVSLERCQSVKPGVLRKEEFDTQKKVILEGSWPMVQRMVQGAVVQPEMMQRGMMQPAVSNVGMSTNAAGQFVNANGVPVIMDGGGRVWSQHQWTRSCDGQ